MQNIRCQVPAGGILEQHFAEVLQPSFLSSPIVYENHLGAVPDGAFAGAAGIWRRARSHRPVNSGMTNPCGTCGRAAWQPVIKVLAS